MQERYLCKAKKINKLSSDTEDYAIGYFLYRNNCPIIYESKKDGKFQECYIVDDTTLSSYTGFKTKSGQLIFEHDYLKSEYGDIGEVKFGLYKNCLDPDGMENYGFYVDWNGRDGEQYYVKNLKYWINVFNAEVIENNM